jgi:hypothetical protein
MMTFSQPNYNIITGKSMAERDEQIKLFQYLKLHPILKDLAFSIPNEAKRSPILGRLLVRMGLRAGVPDIFVPYSSNGYHGLFIELKWGKNKPTPAQSEFIQRLLEQGYQARVCWGADEAIDCIVEYMK